MTSECLQLILAVLKPRQGIGEVLEDEKEEDDSDELEEGKEEDSSSEVEEGKEEEDSDEVEEGKEEDHSDADSSDDDASEVGGVDPVFAESVRRALGAAAAVGSDEEVGLYVLATPLYFVCSL